MASDVSAKLPSLSVTALQAVPFITEPFKLALPHLRTIHLEFLDDGRRRRRHTLHPMEHDIFASLLPCSTLEEIFIGGAPS